ncbi:MAG: hypothetical protein KAR40_00115 [Candidatus Sabulitectum sp.]|nr:hypothetical protein [Candidatus Sabulitectum sp.]
MARKRTLLKRTRRILKYYLEGVTSSRKLSEFVGLSHTKIQGFIRVFSDSPYTFEELLQLDDEALAAVVYPQRTCRECGKIGANVGSSTT